MSVYVCGALHLDVIVAAPRMPRPDETVVGQSVSYALGGKGGNQAVAAARMGARVAMAGAVGGDDFAARLLANLTAAGVDIGRVLRQAGASGMSVAILDDDGAYGAVIVSGSNRLILGEDPIPQGTTVTLLQNEIPEHANLACATRARTAGSMVILNAAPARRMSLNLLDMVDILVVNRIEAADLAGQPDPPPAALAALGPPVILQTLGSGGVILHQRGQSRHFPAHSIPAVSTHGAGDAFLGALAARLDSGEVLETAIDFAQAAAALHVAAYGPDRAAITPDMVRARMKKPR